MKSTKKLFAILTLMMFMMTLLPMAAFAAAVDATAATVTSTTNETGATATYTINVTIPAIAAGSGDVVTINLTDSANVLKAGVFPAAAAASFDTAAGVAIAAGNATAATTAAGALVITEVAGGLAAGTYTITQAVTNPAVGTYKLRATAVAADLASLTIVGGANAFATIVETDKTSVVGDGTSTIKFTVYAYDASNNIVSGRALVVASSRGTTDIFRNSADTANLGAAPTGAAPNYVVTTDAAGKAEFKVKSSVVGAAKIGIGLTDAAATTSVYAYLTGASAASTTTCGLAATKDITFTSPSTNAVAVIGTPVASDASAVAGDGLAAATAWNSATVNGNSIDTYEITFKVTASNGAPVSGQEVTISANKTQVNLNKTTATTDATGVVKVKVSATKPGTYSVKAAAGDKDVTTNVIFAANDLYKVELVSGGNETVAKDAPYSVKFKFSDTNGNQIKYTRAVAVGAATIATTPVNYAAGNIGLKLEATVRPSDSNMDEKIYNNNTTADYSFINTAEGYLKMTIGGGEINKEGTHTVKAYFDNGQVVSFTFEVKKQGTAVDLSVKYDQSAISVNTKTGVPTIKRIDAAGVSKELTAAEVLADIVFTPSDVRMIQSAVGAGDNAFTSGAGDFFAIGDEKYAGTLVITAVDKNKKLSGSATMTINKIANGLTLTAAEATTQIGNDAVIKAQLVDVEGKSIAIGTGVTAVSVDYYVISKPSGAIVSSSTPSTILTDMQKTGAADLKISSNVAGDVKVQVVITTTGTPARTFTQSVDLKFGAPKVVVGAGQVTMFIGATGFMKDGVAGVTDVAPFIQDGRTFVAVRPVADAFGAEIGWDEATQTVTLTRSDMTVTIVIGSNTITVVKDGVTSTVTADVAAMIKDGRTVLPFRAVGEAFGATVSYDAATQSVSYVQ
ncbi:MAG: hypothetical protein CVU87_03145 [Firmicutes bacterium HGW-Firmicutes-12]|nr:MAG: hypothetical protein CVU87_03145 [Firmicutes bacterium HGW-Firmicutes-12]